MDGSLFDELTRGMPLLTRGAGGNGASSRPSVTATKKKRKKKGKGNSGCQRQAQVWELYVTIACETIPDPDCLDALACAEPLEACNFTEFVACYEAAIA